MSEEKCSSLWSLRSALVPTSKCLYDSTRCNWVWHGINAERCHFLTWCLQVRLRRYSGTSCCGNPVLLLFFYIFIKMQQRALELFPSQHSSGGFPIKRYTTCSHANWNLPVKHPITPGTIGCQRGTEFLAFMKFRLKVSKFSSLRGNYLHAVQTLSALFFYNLALNIAT